MFERKATTKGNGIKHFPESRFDGYGTWDEYEGWRIKYGLDNSWELGSNIELFTIIGVHRVRDENKNDMFATRKEAIQAAKERLKVENENMKVKIGALNQRIKFNKNKIKKLK